MKIRLICVICVRLRQPYAANHSSKLVIFIQKTSYMPYFF